MSHLKLHDAPTQHEQAEESIPETFLFPGVHPAMNPARRRVRPSIAGGPAVESVERDLDHVQERLNNLRDLVDRFGLDQPGQGPRAA